MICLRRGCYALSRGRRAARARARVLDARPRRPGAHLRAGRPTRVRARPGRVPRRGLSDTCYIVRSGRARAVREHSDGRVITLATFGPGDIFGELAMFEDERRSATVEAVEPTDRRGGAGPRHAPADGRAPRDLHTPGDRSRPAPARDQRAPGAPVFSDGPEPGRGGPRQSSSSRSARRPPPARTCSSPPPRQISRSWRAPRASRPAASWPCSSAPG